MNTIKTETTSKINSLNTNNEYEDEIPDDIVCPLTNKIMSEPVFAADGYSYECEAIQKYFVNANASNRNVKAKENKNKEILSPKTNQPFQHTNIAPNHNLKQRIEKYHSQANDMSLNSKGQSVEHEKGQFEILIEQANAPIFGIDVDGNVNVWNKMAEKITGFEKVEVIGHNLVDEFITPAFRDAVRNVLEQALISNETSNFEFPLITKSNNRVEVLLNATTRRDIKDNIIGVVGIGQDITLLKAVEHEKGQYVVLIEHANAPIFGIDVDGNINVWNKMTEKITGFEKVEVIGHNLVDEFITPEFRDAVRNVLEQALIGNEMSNFEFPLITKSHDRVEVLLNATTRRDVNCNITGVVGIGQDITLRKTAEIAKKIFLASFSHELRTPLNGLLGMLELLREEHLSDSAHRKVILAHNSSTLLLNLINDILDLSKIEAEQLIVNIEPFDIRVAIASACEILTTALSEKGIALEITVSDKVSTYLVGDVMRVRQILINLLSNAIKFTPEGKIHVKCWCDEDNSETTTNSTTELNKNQESDKPLKQRLYFEVTDTGVGMLDADMLKLFSLFTKIYDSRITNRSGSGLGLAICKKLCNLMNGDISVHSQYGVGTTLAFNLLFDKYVASKHAEGLNGINNGFSLIDPTFGQPPIQWKESSWDVELSSEPDSVAEQQKRQTKTTTLNESLPEKHLGISGAVVLVAEDNLFNWEITKTFIEMSDMTYEWAQNGQIALNLYIANPARFDLILMDCQMPIMDGYRATREIRNYEQSDHYFTSMKNTNVLKNQARKRIPIIALTAHAMSGDHMKCFEYGMDAYLTKPIRRKYLIQHITSHIRTSKKKALNLLAVQSIEENKKALLASSNLVVESAVGVTEGEECLELLENSSSPDSKVIHQEIIKNQDSNGNQDSGNGATKEEENIIEINNRLMRSGEKGAASESKVTQNTKDPFDRKSLAQRLGCSQTSLSNAVITRFLKYLPSAIKNLNEAYDDQNMKKFFAGCHSLKGASGTVSANELHEVLKTIDAMKNLDEDIQTFSDEEARTISDLFKQVNKYCDEIFVFAKNIPLV